MTEEVAVPKKSTRPIFEFYDGVKNRKEDGQKLGLMLTSKLNQDLTDSLAAMDAQPIPPKDGETEGEAKQREAINLHRLRTSAECALTVVQFTREIFGIADYCFDGEKEIGLTDGEALVVFYDFVVWQQDQKKTLELKPFLPASTEQKPLS